MTNAQKEMPERGWLDVIAACKYTGVGATKMREIFRRQDFPVHWVGRKQYVKISDLDRYIEEGRTA